MAKHGKKYRKISEALEGKREMELEDALKFIKEHPAANFDETMEIAFRMGLDPTKSDQALRSTLALPHGTGRDVRVVVFASGDAAEAAREAVLAAGIGPRDALIGIAASGRTPYTVGAVLAAREAGAFTVGIASVAGSPLLRAAEIGVWLDTGPEVLAGSTRLAAGTAQKASLNLLSTTVLVRLGGAYGNLMVGMQPTNEKLRLRAQAMVARATGAEADAAAAALKASGDDVRAAIVMLLAGTDAATAARLLDEHGLRVRDAVAALGVSARPR